MPNSVNSSSPTSPQPHYAELVRFLLTPLLDSPENLRIHCESTNQNQRVWIRLALEQTDQGKVFGRGGRNLSAIRTVLNAAALAADQSVYLDIYGAKETATEVGKRGKPDQRSEPSSKAAAGKEGKNKKKPQKRPKPSPKRSSSQLTPKNS
ncbi:MAG: KH domain-containing protein [Halothece sp.]